MKELPPLTYPTFARELLAAREGLGVPQEVGLAVRADRRRLGLSQRGYARARQWPLSRVIRLESAAADLKLRDVIAALDDTPFVLALCHRPEPPADPPPAGAALAAPTAPVPVRADHWPRTELLAKVRDGSRRFPAHHPATQVTTGPSWWWGTEATRIGTVPPNWYARRVELRERPA